MRVSGEIHDFGTNWRGGFVGPSVGLHAVAKRKNPHPCQKSNLVRAARSLVTVLTELTLKIVFILQILHTKV